MVVAAGEITPYLPWILLQVIDGPFTVRGGGLPASALLFRFCHVSASVCSAFWAAKRGLIYLWVWLHGRGKRAALFF